MTLMYLYYNQQEAIKKMESLGYPNSGIDVVIIDDGSKTPLKCDWATVYRIDKDIPWNMPQANNLGFSKIKGTVLRMDMDHSFTLEDLNRLSQIEVKEKQLIKFRRLYKGKIIYPGPNIYLARVDDIVNAGGYDERFCGNYGYEDGELMQRLNKKGFVTLMSEIICHVDDSLSTKGLERDTAINYNKYLKALEKSNL